MNEKENEIEIDLKQIFAVIIGKLPIIIVVMILGGMIAFAYSRFLVKPVYESTTKVHILNNTEGNNITSSDLQAGAFFAKDYKEIVKSAPVMEQVIEELSLDANIEQLRSLITVDVIADTRILTISVKNTDPYMAKKIADSVREVSKDTIVNIMDIKSINTVEEGNLPLTPVTPDIVKNTIIGAFLGMLLTVAAVVLKFMLDDTIKTPDDVEKYLELSVLATIPKSVEEYDGKGRNSKKGKKSKKKGRK